MTRAPTERKGKRTAFCLSLGCAKNRVDSERILGVLSEAGYEIVGEPQGATLCIVNTCGFLQSAVKENIESILALVSLKEKGETERIGVVGCLVNRYGTELRENLPEVDLWARCEDFSAILHALDSPGISSHYPPRRRLPGHAPHTRYLKLAEGCNNSCSYCAIPGIRGGLKSLPISLLLGEAGRLVDEGATEICLVAQDLTAYGADLSADVNLYALLDELEASLPAGIWLRLLYLHPWRVSKRLLERVAGGSRILPYLDIPLQHASARVLSSMNRAMDEGALLEIFKSAREIRGDFALRTTCMVGFPGETRGDFEKLLRFLDAVRFDRVGAFTFSPEEGTPAASLSDQVPNRTKRARLERLMALQAELSLERQRLFVGKTLEILIDEVFEDGSAEGRSFREAPEVDGVVGLPPPFPGGAHLRRGHKVSARITEAFEHDMTGEVCGVMRRMGE